MLVGYLPTLSGRSWCTIRRSTVFLGWSLDLAVEDFFHDYDHTEVKLVFLRSPRVQASTEIFSDYFRKLTTLDESQLDDGFKNSVKSFNLSTP